jgi:hypothetical protein
LDFANGAGVIRFDPAKHEQAPLPDPLGWPFTSLLFEGNTVWAFGNGATSATNIRTCDGVVTRTMILPGPFAQAAFDGQHTWIVYQNGANWISVR